MGKYKGKVFVYRVLRRTRDKDRIIRSGFLLYKWFTLALHKRGLCRCFVTCFFTWVADMVYNVPTWRFLWPVFVFRPGSRWFAYGGFIAALRPLFLSLSVHIGTSVIDCRSVRLSLYITENHTK